MDTDHQADEAWILGVQCKLYQWSKAHPDEAGRDMWGGLPSVRFRLAWMRTPDFATSSGEPDADRKTHVRFGERR